MPPELTRLSKEESCNKPPDFVHSHSFGKFIRPNAACQHRLPDPAARRPAVQGRRRCGPGAGRSARRPTLCWPARRCRLVRPRRDCPCVSCTSTSRPRRNSCNSCFPANINWRSRGLKSGKVGKTSLLTSYPFQRLNHFNLSETPSHGCRAIRGNCLSLPH